MPNALCGLKRYLVMKEYILNKGGEVFCIMCKYILNYELKNGKTVVFEFDESIDFEKYNKTILNMYKKQIIRRFVVNVEDGTLMSLRELRNIIAKGGDTDGLD